jgi:urease subunit alpha
MRPTFGDAIGADLSLTFVSPYALDDGLAGRLGLRRRLAALKDTRATGKADMKANDALPTIDIRPDTFEIAIDEAVVTPAPADVLPLAQLYTMF